MQACSSGSSGSLPSARNHIRWVGAGYGFVGRSADRLADVADVDRSGPVVAARRGASAQGAIASVQVGRVSGSGTSGICSWWLTPSSWTWNDADRWKIGLAPLDGGHPAGGEGPAVADAVHLVEDRDPGIAGAEEVGVQRVHRALPALAVGDRAAGGDQGLAATWPPKTRRRCSGG